MIDKSKLTKKKPIIAIIMIVIIAGAVLVNQEALTGFANAVMSFETEDGAVAQCSVTTSMSAYSADGLITKQVFQSGFYLEGQEVEYIVFEIDLVFSGTDVNWNTLSTQVNIWANPTEGEQMLVATVIIGFADVVLEGELYKYHITVNIGEGVDDGMDASGSTTVESGLAVLLGLPIETLADGTDIHELSMEATVRAIIMDLKDQEVNAGLDISALWTLNTLPDGTLNINTEGGTAPNLTVTDVP